MSDKSIIFSGPMVAALLDEIDTPGVGKTQTRRAHPPEPRFEPHGCSPANLGGRPCWWDFWRLDSADVHRFKLPYAVGDRLYVREDWRTNAAFAGSLIRNRSVGPSSFTSIEMADEWLHPREAKPDGTVCHIQLRDALGPYLLPGRFFFHDDGYWYRIDPPRRIESVVYRWKPAAEKRVK